MPILPPEPEVYPATLFHEPPEGCPRIWWILHTKPRQEKSLARQLYEGKIPFYLPQIQRRSLIRGRTITSQVPLFASYLFLRAHPEERLAALMTSRVVHTLKVVDQEGLRRDIQQIHRLISSGAAITPEDRLVPGIRVEIRSGPLTGLKGKIRETASRRRFVVEVDFIQRGASVVLDDFVLHACDM